MPQPLTDDQRKLIHDLALAAFETALRGDPKDPRFYRAVGIANGLLGTHEEAQRVFRAGLLAAPEDVALRNNLGLSLVQSGRYDEGGQWVVRLPEIWEDGRSEDHS